MAAISSSDAEKTNKQYKPGQVTDFELKQIDEVVNKVVKRIIQDAGICCELIQRDEKAKRKYEGELNAFCRKNTNEALAACLEHLAARIIKQKEKKPDEAYKLAVSIALLTYGETLFDSIVNISPQFIGNLKVEKDLAEKRIDSKGEFLRKLGSCKLNELRELDLLFSNLVEMACRDTISSHTVREIATYIQSIPKDYQFSVIKEFEKATAALIEKEEETEYIIVDKDTKP